MRSMTGFGAGEAPSGSGKICVEIRSVNHRFLDMRVRMPQSLGDLAAFVESSAREKLTRGRFEISVRTEGTSPGAPVLDRERARAAYRAFAELRDELSPGADVPLSLLATVPDLFVSTLERELDTVRVALRAALEAAITDLDAMRAREGAALALDLAQRTDAVRRIALQIQQRSPELIAAQKRRLTERIERLRLAHDVALDPGRLEQEIAIFSERVDICEELTRLACHCDQMLTHMGARESAGRRLDFLLQEMAREANTIGSKSPDAGISHAVVELKAEIERMREQVQNVE